MESFILHKFLPCAGCTDPACAFKRIFCVGSFGNWRSDGTTPKTPSQFPAFRFSKSNWQWKPSFIVHWHTPHCSVEWGMNLYCLAEAKFLPIRSCQSHMKLIFSCYLSKTRVEELPAKKSAVENLNAKQKMLTLLPADKHKDIKGINIRWAQVSNYHYWYYWAVGM